MNKNVDQVVAELKSAHPNKTIQKVRNNGVVTCDFRFDRIRVYYDKHGKVTAITNG